MAGQVFSPREDLSGIEVDPSEVEKQNVIGSGCTAEVYLGMFRGREVAIKQIEFNKVKITKAAQRAFDREVAIMAKVECDNLVRLLGICSLQQPLFLITELCSGGCLFELLHNQADDVELVWGQQLKMCRDVAQAMDYLHKFDPQIIHRDLKSLNLLLVEPITGPDCVPFVKVSDFGLARMKDSAATDWGKMTIAAGTCHWMAPEVHSSNRYDCKVDVYSYAMILFEIICREIPFEEEEPAAVGRLAQAGMRPDMEAVPPDCPARLCDLMTVCWAQDPNQRPAFDSILAHLAEFDSL